ARVRTGPLGKFFHWWFDELRQSLPAPWQQKLQHALRRVTFVLVGDSLIVGVDENRQQQLLDSFAIAQDAALQKQQLASLLLQHDLAESPRYLLLERDTILCKEMTLPVATEPNLAQVLAFEMDRQTPFKASDVYFGWKIRDRNGETGQIRLEIYVAPRRQVDKAIHYLNSRGLSPTGVDVLEEGKTMGLNLLPVGQRVREVNRKMRMNFILAGAAAVLLALVMTQSLYLRSHQVFELEAAIAEVRDEALLVQRIKEQIGDTSEAAGFLTVRRSASPLAIELLADITRILPEDTYLDRLVINRTSVQMQGKSQNAQRLIELVNQSELLDEAAFRGSTRLDARTGLEIFEINAKISGVEES
ncbi:MAG: PilN domain-containing protein, partial [Xanthomonadales bacterium]